MSALHQKSLANRVGQVTAILSSSTLSLLLVGVGCAPAPVADVPVDTSVGVKVDTEPVVPPINAAIEAPGLVPPEEATATSLPTPKPTPSPTPTPTAAPTPTPTPISRKYKDGAYTADGFYQSPAGSEKVGVTLTIKDDAIVNVTMTEHATNQKSIAMQKAFIGGISAVVVGKNLDEVNVGKISGSSLTGEGFNEAVAKIKLKAKG